MTENEAIEILKENQLEHYHIDIDEYKETDITVRNMAIQALEEIQQYRAIGTVEECQQRKEYFDIINEVLKNYSDIGTIEECRVAVERMKPKKYARKGGNYDCPVCGYFIFTSTGTRKKYCSNCGQSIDWSE